MPLLDTPLGSDIAHSLNRLALLIYKGNVLRGFWEPPAVIQNLANADTSSCQLEATAVVDKLSKRNVGELIALVHSELSEALEAHRKDLNDDKLPHRKGLEVELADALIRILDMAAGLGLNIGEATVEKLDYNDTRPYKHGKNY